MTSMTTMISNPTISLSSLCLPLFHFRSLTIFFLLYIFSLLTISTFSLSVLSLSSLSPLFSMLSLSSLSPLFLPLSPYTLSLIHLYTLSLSCLPLFPRSLSVLTMYKYIYIYIYIRKMSKKVFIIIAKHLIFNKRHILCIFIYDNKDSSIHMLDKYVDNFLLLI